MSDFLKMCNEYEKLGWAERAAILTEKSVKVLAKLRLLNVPGIDPVVTLASFVIGSAAADGTLDEKEYLLMYPALIRVFGDDFDYSSVKRSFGDDRQGKKAIRDCTADMLTVLGVLDEGMRADVTGLCLAIVTADGRFSLRERMYVKRLCRA